MLAGDDWNVTDRSVSTSLCMHFKRHLQSRTKPILWNIGSNKANSRAECLKKSQGTYTVDGCVLTCSRSDFCRELSAEADRCCQSESGLDSQTVKLGEAHQWLAYIQMSLGAQLAVGRGGKSGRKPESPDKTEDWAVSAYGECVRAFHHRRGVLHCHRDTQGWGNMRCITTQPLRWQEWWSIRQIWFLVPGYRSLGFFSSGIPKEFVPIFLAGYSFPRFERAGN